MYNYYDNENDPYFINNQLFNNPFINQRGFRLPDTIDYSFKNYVQQDPLSKPTTNTYIKILNLNNEMRRLWFEHIFWTRLVILSIVNGSNDLKYVSERLLQNPIDFENQFSKYYSAEISKKFGTLLKEHLLIAADLVTAAKNQNNQTFTLLNDKWYKNADEIANFLNSINPYWNENDIKEMMYKHLDLTKSEAGAVISRKYEDSIKLFDEIQSQALKMADTFTEGLLKQFPNKF